MLKPMTEEQKAELKKLLDEVLRVTKVTLREVVNLGLLDLTKLNEAQKRYAMRDAGMKRIAETALQNGTDASYVIARECLLEAITVENQELAAYVQMATARAGALAKDAAAKGMLN